MLIRETRPPTLTPRTGWPPNTPRLSSRMERENKKADRDQSRKLRRPGFRKWMNSMSKADIRLIAREINSRVGVWIILTHPWGRADGLPRLNLSHACLECVSATPTPQARRLEKTPERATKAGTSRARPRGHLTRGMPARLSVSPGAPLPLIPWPAKNPATPTLLYIRPVYTGCIHSNVDPYRMRPC